MTLSHATSDRDWCKLDDLFNVPCFTLRGFLYEIHAVMRLSIRLGKGPMLRQVRRPELL